METNGTNGMWGTGWTRAVSCRFLEKLPTIVIPNEARNLLGKQSRSFASLRMTAASEHAFGSAL